MLINYLKQIPLFAHLKDAQLKAIASQCKKVLFKKGSVIFQKTDMSTDLYIVDAGRLKAILSDDEGDEIVLAQFDKGAFFGELSLLDGKGRSATIVTDSDSELSVLSQADFLELLSKDPKIATGSYGCGIPRFLNVNAKPSGTPASRSRRLASARLAAMSLP